MRVEYNQFVESKRSARGLQFKIIPAIVVDTPVIRAFLVNIDTPAHLNTNIDAWEVMW